MEDGLTIEEMDQQALLQALFWQVETGCDDALLDDPQNAAEWTVSLKEIMATHQPDLDLKEAPAIAPVVAPMKPTPSGSTLAEPPQVKTPSTPRPQTSASVNAITDLSALKAALSSFEGCELKRTASNLVFCDGNQAAKIMIIGEAPGKDEDRMGLPFVGSAGQLLDQMLGAVGLDRTRVYIANIMPWRPPGNRALTVEETEMMRPFVEKHISLIAPDVILSLGGTASKMLLQSQEGIMKIRGKFHDYATTDAPQNIIPLLPCLHPGYLLRSPHHKAFAFKDLVKLRRKALELAS